MSKQSNEDIKPQTKDKNDSSNTSNNEPIVPLKEAAIVDYDK